MKDFIERRLEFLSLWLRKMNLEEPRRKHSKKWFEWKNQCQHLEQELITYKAKLAAMDADAEQVRKNKELIEANLQDMLTLCAKNKSVMARQQWDFLEKAQAWREQTLEGQVNIYNTLKSMIGKFRLDRKVTLVRWVA